MYLWTHTLILYVFWVNHHCIEDMDELLRPAKSMDAIAYTYPDWRQFLLVNIASG